jgi:cation diffusion facilitator CzcD-associated flavoprotein CzcO
MAQPDVAIVGAGPAGIAAALAIKDRGMRPLVFDEADTVASSWRTRYDRLRLNTCRPFSHLPGRRFPKGTPMFASSDDLLEHVDRHAHEEGIELRLGTAVERLERDDGGWVARTSEGDIRAPEMIVSTGLEKAPVIPAWEGRDSFQGRLLHSADYRNSEPFGGEDVLVVGPGCSGMEIAYDLVEGGAAKVWLSARTPPNVLLREGPGGVPGDMMGVALLHFPPRFGDAVTRFGRRQDLGDLTEYGLPIPEEGVFSRLRRLGAAPAIVDREVIDAIRDGRIEIVRGVQELDPSGVRLADGMRVEPDAVICATGYRSGLEPLVGHLDVLDEKGMPRCRGEQAPLPGLRFIGYVPRPGGLGYFGKEARRAAKAISRELRDGVSRH